MPDTHYNNNFGGYAFNNCRLNLKYNAALPTLLSMAIVCISNDPIRRFTPLPPHNVNISLEYYEKVLNERSIFLAISLLMDSICV